MTATFQKGPEKLMMETEAAKPWGDCPHLCCLCSCSEVVIEKLIIHRTLRDLEETTVCWKKNVPTCLVVMLGFRSHSVVCIPNLL